MTGKTFLRKQALNELIIALMRKKVLTDIEGKAMLQKLLRDDHRTSQLRV